MIIVREAMLSMNLTYDGMAKLLGLSRATILRMCMNGEAIPARLEHRVRHLIGPFRKHMPETQTVFEAVDDLLVYLNERKGGAIFRDVNAEFGLTGRQLKNIEDVEGWVTLVWENTSKYGRVPFCYLTAAGYIKLGVVMPEDALAPSSNARPMAHVEHINQAERAFLEVVGCQMHDALRLHDDLKSLYMMVVRQAFASLDEAIEMYARLTAHYEPPRLTHEKGDDEDES